MTDLIYSDNVTLINFLLLGAVARSEACPLGMQVAPEFDPHVRHILSWNLVVKTFL